MAAYFICIGYRVLGKEWSLNLDTLDKFIGLIICHGIVGVRNWPLKSLWNSDWVCPMFSKTMSRDDLAQKMSILRFDVKSERRDRIEHNKFCLASYIWQSFIENCQKSYIPSQNLTVDEQLLLCKARCKFIQYMANKPDKFGLKFWLIVDVNSKYLYNGFPYVGKDETHATSTSLSTDVVLKLIEPLANCGKHNLIKIKKLHVHF